MLCYCSLCISIDCAHHILICLEYNTFPFQPRNFSSSDYIRSQTKRIFLLCKCIVILDKCFFFKNYHVQLIALIMNSFISISTEQPHVLQSLQLLHFFFQRIKELFINICCLCEKHKQQFVQLNEILHLNNIFQVLQQQMIPYIPINT